MYVNIKEPRLIPRPIVDNHGNTFIWRAGQQGTWIPAVVEVDTRPYTAGNITIPQIKGQ